MLRFKIWLYTGEIAEPQWQEGICEAANHVLLYIFADKVGILARRKVMDYITLRAPLLPMYDTVRLIFTNLPATSPLRKHTMRAYIAHWSPELDGEDEYAKALEKDTKGVLEGFVEKVQRGVARRAADHDVDDITVCSCCGDACGYHEHESHAEWADSMFLPSRCLFSFWMIHDWYVEQLVVCTRWCLTDCPETALVKKVMRRKRVTRRKTVLRMRKKKAERRGESDEEEEESDEEEWDKKTSAVIRANR
jgi:hypothetical protein